MNKKTIKDVNVSGKRIAGALRLTCRSMPT